MTYQQDFNRDRTEFESTVLEDILSGAPVTVRHVDHHIKMLKNNYTNITQDPAVSQDQKSEVTYDYYLELGSLIGCKRALQTKRNDVLFESFNYYKNNSDMPRMEDEKIYAMFQDAVLEAYKDAIGALNASNQNINGSVSIFTVVN